MENEEIRVENVDETVAETCDSVTENSGVAEVVEGTSAFEETIVNGEAESTDEIAEETVVCDEAVGADRAALIDEAYLRGRNDAIREMLSRPGLYERPGEKPGGEGDDEDGLTSGFLTRLRPSAWD